ncbi:MAG: hypothetical protein KAJ18_10410 [Candidatus Omnitrophica bacterium]|nr:hypothetical protein [Candidatus Omnitrophota bacterium]
MFYLRFFIISSLLFFSTTAGAFEKDVVEQALNQFEGSLETGEGFSVEGSGDTVVVSRPAEKQIRPLIDVLDFEKTDINEVLQVITQKSGIEFIVEGRPQGDITVYLYDIDVWRALEIILEVNRLAYIKEEKGVRIVSAQEYKDKYGYAFPGNRHTRIVPVVHAELETMVPELTPKKSSGGEIFVDSKFQQLILWDFPEILDSMENIIQEKDVPLETEIFNLQYIQARDLEEEIQGMLTEDLGRAEFDERANKIVVTDVLEVVEKVAQLIEQEDKKIEVLSRIQLVKINLNEEHKQGVDWEAIVSQYQKVPLQLIEGVEKKGVRQLSLGIVTNEDFEVLLDALEIVGKKEMLIYPDEKMIVNEIKELSLDAKSLSLFGEEEEPGSNVSVVSVLEGFSVQTRFLPQLLEKDVLEMKLFVKVHLVSEGERSTRSKKIKFVPEKDIVVKVNKDETIVMGGMFFEKEVSKMSRLPFFGRIPFVGSVFSHEKSLIEKNEYMIFLTPEILVEGKP